MATTSSADILCVSLGMIIIDEIRMPNRPILQDVIGGSATFVTLGQRLFASDLSTVGLLVIAGDDFPASVKEKIKSWGTTLVVKKREGRPSTRGRLEYKDDTFGPKAFTYIGEPLRATPADLVDTPLLKARAFHLFGTPKEILSQVPELLEYRQKEGLAERPFVVWEPLPAACTKENRQSFLEACKLVDVFSPNHIEIAALFGDPPSGDFEMEKLESYSQLILESSAGPIGEGVIVIRAGEYGAASMSRRSRATWLPPYYEHNSSKVVDPTGAGNTFLGGYIAGWQRTGNIHDAMCYAQVAASFALEQIGLPDHQSEGDNILWNVVSAEGRLEEYKIWLSEAKVKSERVL